MAEIKLTDAQKAVVNDRSGTLLVSAAAGSGKTRVLIDRVLKRVMEENCNVDDFLMITFTQAAAAELRGKLIAGLSERLALTPHDRHLQEQMSRVYLAQISTVHAFCSVLLREYAHELELPADFRVCDEQEALTLRERVMQTLLEDIYREKTEELGAAVDMFGAGRDDKALPALIFKCYKDLCCHIDPETALDELRERLQYERYTDIAETVWGKYLMNELRIYLQGCLHRAEEACRIIDETECLQAYQPAFAVMRQTLQAMLDANSWDALRAVPQDYGKLKGIRNCPEPEKKEYVQSIRKRISEDVEKRMTKFAASSQEALEDLKHNAPAMRGLLSMTEQFLKRYAKEKQRRHVLDYNDLEHETLRLLYGRSMSRTAAAKQISERFTELMIDEYQDTNAVQDAIFSAISRNGKNLFFVGDVKQSIYGFRMADPEIFLEKYKAFDSYEVAKDGEPRKILLSDNFRSIAPILSAANDVFRLTMTERVGGLRYGDAEALRANNEEVLQDAAVELHCIDTSDVPTQPRISREEIEAEFVARRISNLLKTQTLPLDKGFRPIVPEDIVILLRSLNKKAPVYQAALRRYGIRSVCGSEALFETEEIGFLYALLQVLDNPHQDIPLLTVLLSPVLRFSPDVLAQLRGKRRDGDLFDVLQESEAAQSFLETLQSLRDTAQQESLHTLLDTIDETLGVRAAFPNGQQNIDRLLALADGFEGADRFGLSAFVQYLTVLREKGVSADDPESRGAVRLMTVHKSKGLEFPVVVLADLCKRFNIADSTDTVLLDPKLGIGATVYDTEDSVSYPTVAHSAISARIRKEDMSEEMRVLYVAMTRPRHRLIMTCCASGLKKKIASMAGELRVPPLPSQIEAAGCLGDWVLMTALTHTESGALYPDAVQGRHVSEHPWHMTMQDGTDYLPEPEMTQNADEGSTPLPEPTAFVYRHSAAAQTPSKLTATQLKGRDLDSELSEQTTMPMLRFSKPRFDRNGLSATQRGTAIHLAMQYLRYEACTCEQGVKQELDRLVQERFLTQEQAQAVPPRKLLRFFQSDLGQYVLRAEKVVREFKFSILEDGAAYDSKLSGETLLLQGVTDCCILDGGMLTILDFKSDRIAPGEEAARAEHYRGQIEAYCRALSRIFGLPVKDRILYFFATDTAYTI